MVAVAALSLPDTAAIGVCSARLRRDLRFRALATRSLTARSLGCAAAIAVALAGGGAWSLIAQQLAVAGLLAALLLAGWRPGLRLERERLRELARFALPQLLRQSLWVGRLQGFLMLAGAFAGLTALGHLNLAFRIVNTLQSLLATALQQFALPHFARRQGSRPAMIEGYERAAQAIATVTFPVFAGLALAARDLVPAALGEQWRPAVPATEILACGALVVFAGFAASIVVTAAGRLRYAVISAVAATATTFAGLFWLRPDDAALAAALWAAPLVLPALLGLHWLRRILGLSPAAQLRPLLAPALAAAAMALAVAALRAALAEAPAMLRLAEEIAIGAAVYAAVLLAVDRSGRLLTMLPALAGRRALEASAQAGSPTWHHHGETRR